MNIKPTNKNSGETASLLSPTFSRSQTTKQSTPESAKSLDRREAAVASALINLRQTLLDRIDAGTLGESANAKQLSKKANQAIKEFPEFASVISGNILVNGQSIDINFSTDSLADIIARIDSLDGVNAETNPKLIINSSNSGSRLDLVDNGTGFLAAVYMAGGSPRPLDFPAKLEAPEVGTLSEEQSDLEIADLAKEIGAVFDQQPQMFGVEQSLESVKTELMHAMGDDGIPERNSEGKRIRFDPKHAIQFADANTVAGTNVQRLINTIDSMLTETARGNSQTGIIIDVFA